MGRRYRRRVLAAPLTVSIVMAGLVSANGVASADAPPGAVVISELNYNDVSGLDDGDFVELTNTGDSPADVSGWSFTEGVSGTLPVGSVISPGGYYVIAKSSDYFRGAHGFVPDATYGGNLSNKGETVTISAADGTPVSTVTYSVTSPWPTAPNGTGPSLELRNLGSDPSLPGNWGASLVDKGTPRALNSIDGTDPEGPAEVGDLEAKPFRPLPNQAVVVSARLPMGSTATLTYKVMFGNDVTIPFTDGADSPGGANDGHYVATIPGQGAGKLIRYRIDADSQGMTVSEPPAGDSMSYRGVVVTDPAVNSQAPTIEWFMDDTVYEDILANHRMDKLPGPAVWTYDGQVWDGVLMNVRGRTSRNAVKVSWTVELPKGYEFDLGGQLPYPLKKFALNNEAPAFADMAWAVIAEAGARSTSIIPVRTQRNGEFWSLGRIIDSMNGPWRADQGVKKWSIYKGDGGALADRRSMEQLVESGWLDKKTREDEDFSDVWELVQAVNQPKSSSQLAWLYKNVNIPELINYLAINTIIRHEDSGGQNWWVARDTEGTGRWDMWHWDLDYTFITDRPNHPGPFLTPDTSNRFTRAMLAYPEFTELFYRRLRTLADQILVPGKYEAKWNAIRDRVLPAWKLDKAKWGGYTPNGAGTTFYDGLQNRRDVIRNNTPALVPISQNAAPNIVINEINYDPGPGGSEFIELANPNATAIDISGWTIPSVDLTVQPGTVIPAHGYVVFVGNDVAFRNTYPSANRLVGGEFSAKLADQGQTVELRQGNRIVDTVTYSASAPWPVGTAGVGMSLELNSVSVDNSLPSNWHASTSPGGTPGLENTKVGVPDSEAPSVPGGVVASGIGPDVVSLSWHASTDNVGVTGYQVSRDGAVVATPASPSYTDSGLSPSTTYTYVIRAIDAAGNLSGSSSPVSVTTLDVSDPTNVLFTDKFNGTNSSPWGSAWTTTNMSGSARINNDAGTLAFSNVTDANVRAELTELAARADSETLLSYQWGPESGVGYFNVSLRASNGWRNSYRPRDGYTLEFSSKSSSVLLKGSINGVSQTIQTYKGAQSTSNEKQWLRVRIVGSTIQVKIWVDGTPEPSNWTATTTEATVTGPGRLFLSVVRSGSSPAAKTITIDDLVITTGGN